MKISLIVVAIGLAWMGQAKAALVWENPLVELHPAVTDSAAVAHFKYKNTGDKPVKITAVRPSCGCTTAAPPTDPVAPGASGEIVATFNIGDRTGVQTKAIHVTTDATDAAQTTLTLRATVPQLLELKPTFLFWNKDEPLEPKTIHAKVGGDFAITKLDVTCTDPDVTAVAKPVPNEKAFEITVTPKPGHRPINASLKIQPDFPKEKPKTFSAYLRIDAHPAAALPK